MQAINSYDACGFGAFLSQPQAFTLDLSNASILEVIDELIRFKQLVSPRYGKNFTSLKRQINLIQQSFNCILMPNQVTDVFWNHFISFQLNVSKLSLSTIKTNCNQLRTCLNFACKHNCQVHPTFEYVSIPSYAHEQIALTPDEVSHIYHFNVKAIDRRPQYQRNMERVRDMFVLSCSLGQRYSDMIRIDKTCFDRNVFSIMQQKTGHKCRVDIDKMSMDSTTTYKLLEKYNYTAPIQGDLTAHNRYIKQLLQYIGDEFNEVVRRETKVNGVIDVEYVPKWKLVCSHTCRRTFATVNILRGYSESDVRRGTGHSSGAFDKYLCYFD